MTGMTWYQHGAAAAGGQSYVGAALDLWFAQNRYQIAGMDSTFEDATDFARASVADWFANDGVSLAPQAAINVPRIDARGVLIEPARTAWGNPAFAGAVATAPGVAGAFPTDWVVQNPTGLTRTVLLETVSGVPFLRVRWQGVTTSSSPFAILSTTASTAVPAAPGQTWGAQCLAQVTRDDPAITSISSNITGRTAAGAGVVDSPFVQWHATRLALLPRTVTFTVPAGATERVTHRLFTTNTIGNGVNVDFEVLIALPNLAQDAPSSPVIGSGTGSVTRASDLLTVPVWPAPSAAGTAVLVTGGYEALSTENVRLLALANGAGNEQLALLLLNGVARVQSLIGGVSSFATLTGAVLPAAGRNVIALRWGAGSVAASVNGAAPVSAALALTPAAFTRASIGSQVTGASSFNGRVERLVQYPTARSDADMQALSQLATWGG